MTETVDDGLDDFEINERDRWIADAFDEITRFNTKYGLDLPLARYERTLTPTLSEDIIIVGRPRNHYGPDYVRKRIKEVSHDVLQRIAKMVLADIGSRPMGDPALRGSAYAVSLKLTVSRMLRKSWRVGADESELYIDRLEILNIDFCDIVNHIAELYEKNYMRYRLWDRQAMERLGRMLFVGDKDCDIYELPGLEDDDTDEHLMSKEEFVEQIEDIIINLPRTNCTETPFPCDSDTIFSEYVPARYMDAQFIGELYERYTVK